MRAGSDHIEMQGSHSGRSPAAGRLCDWRHYRTRIGDAVRFDRDRRAGCGRTATETVALYDPGHLAIQYPQSRSDDPGAVRNGRQSEEHACGTCGVFARRQRLGRECGEDVRQQVSEALDVPTKGLSPQGTMAVARAVLPRETVATCDAGASRLLVVQKWQTYGPREF